MVENNQLILQAIESAERSLSVAKQLLGGGVTPAATAALPPSKFNQLLGEVGAFDGESLNTETGRKYQLPPNYASKSLLVVGDVLRMIEGSDGIKRFKQIQKIPRLKINGILTKKDGQWAVVTEQGSFKVLPASVKHYQGEIGDEVSVLIPKDYKRLRAGWAALEKLLSKKESTAPVEEKKEERPKMKEKITQKPFLPPEPLKKPTKPVVKKASTAPKPQTVAVAQKEKPKLEPKPEEPEKKEIKGEIKVEEEELR